MNKISLLSTDDDRKWIKFPKIFIKLAQKTTSNNFWKLFKKTFNENEAIKKLHLNNKFLVTLKRYFQNQRRSLHRQFPPGRLEDVQQPIQPVAPDGTSSARVAPSRWVQMAWVKRFYKHFSKISSIKLKGECTFHDIYIYI